MDVATQIFQFLNMWIAFPATAGGLIYAIVQVNKTKSASEAAKESIERAERSISRNQLILLIPTLHRTEGDLENAIEGGERRLAAYHLSSWKWFGSQLRTYLPNQNEDDVKLAQALQTSIALASDAKIEAMDQENKLAAACKPALQSIAVVTGELGRIAAIEMTKASSDAK
ncbi:hypothetical protein [Kineococcus sp. SYSU DK004]|uniref:hypothetical protein n=1 Tax=Kineococcus sp. SYSU DK004 TaxID=3383125 RepID=UPI003D7D5CCC